jgi:hypothetical protein
MDDVQEFIRRGLAEVKLYWNPSTNSLLTIATSQVSSGVGEVRVLPMIVQLDFSPASVYSSCITVA